MDYVRINALYTGSVRIVILYLQVEELTENKHILNKYTISLFCKILIL